MDNESRRGRLRALGLSIAAAAILAGCGAGADTTTPQAVSPVPPQTPSPAPPPPSPSPSPAPAGALTYYFSDCQAGASAGCIPGENGNPGTSATAPRRTLAGLDVNTLPAGSQLLFARGGAWTGFNVQLHNLNVTAASPLVFDSYAPAWGGTARPWLKAGGTFYAFETSIVNRTEDTGGYTIRNLKLDGVGAAGAWGVHLRNLSHDVVLDNLEITGFEIAVHLQNESPIGRVTVRNSHLHHNSDMGLHGASVDLVIEGNRFEANNFSGSSFSHAIYLGGHGRNGVIRNNTFTDNSVANGVCTGGNVTVHGQWDGLLIEGNTIRQTASTGSCYGFSITPGYTLPEFFRHVVLRHNTVVNVGGCAICAGAAAAPLIEDNLLINRQNTWMNGVVLGANVGTPGVGGDDLDDGAIVRNNTLCSTHLSGGSQFLFASNAGTVTQTGNAVRTGADASTGVCAP